MAGRYPPGRPVNRAGHRVAASYSPGACQFRCEGPGVLA